MENIGIFQGISKPEMDEMLRCFGAVVRKYLARDVILCYSKMLRNVCVVLDGAVEVTCLDVDGNQNVVETLESGDVFGELFLLPLSSFMYEVTAKSDCEILFIEYDRIINRCSTVCGHHNQLINNLFLLAAKKAQTLSRRIAVLSQKTLRQKLMLYLEYLALEKDSKSFELPMPLSRLAEYLSVDRSAMTRELGKMRAEHLIDQSGRYFTVLEHS